MGCMMAVWFAQDRSGRPMAVEQKAVVIGIDRRVSGYL